MLPVGHILNETYQVEGLLGHGGMAAVYMVSHTRLPRRFALKMIAANMAGQANLIERFRREADILATLDHPHVVNVVDWNVYQGQYPYLVMELLEGEDLSQFLRRQGPLDPTVALPIFLQISEALAAAHIAGIIHRDLKPANVFLCRNGPFANFIKVLDYGIAKLISPHSGLQTQNSAVLGTPAYMAPEQALGKNSTITAQTDQFALAAILYEMLAGKPAFYRPGEPTLLTLTRVVYENPEPLLDPELNRVILRALQKDPANRYPTLREFVEASGALDLSGAMPILAHRTLPLRQTLFQRNASATSASVNQLASRESHGELRPRRASWRPLAGFSAAGALLGGFLLTGVVLWQAWRANTPQPISRVLRPNAHDAENPPARSATAPVEAERPPPPLAADLPDLAEPGLPDASLVPEELPSVPEEDDPALPEPEPQPLKPSNPSASAPAGPRLARHDQTPEKAIRSAAETHGSHHNAPGLRSAATLNEPKSAAPSDSSHAVQVSVENSREPQLSKIKACTHTTLRPWLPKLVGRNLRLRYNGPLQVYYRDIDDITEKLDDCLKTIPVPDHISTTDVVIHFFRR